MLDTGRCLLCQHNQLNGVNCRDGRQYFECQDCHYLFLDPRQRLPLSEERSRYLLHDNRVTEPSYLKYLQKTWDKLSPKSQAPGSQVLDYGCGPTKGLESVLKNSDISVTSYDPIFYPERDWAKASFDVVFCSEALEHAFAPADVFSDWCQTLKPNGCVVLRTQFHSGLDSVEAWWYASDPTHVGFFNAQTFAFVAKRWGFQVEHLHSPYVVLARK